LNQKFPHNEIIGEQNVIFDSLIHSLSREKSFESTSNQWEAVA